MIRQLLSWASTVPPALTILGHLSLLIFVGDFGLWISDNWLKMTRLLWEVLLQNTIELNLDDVTKDSLTAISIFLIASLVRVEEPSKKTFDKIKLRAVALTLLPVTVYILSASAIFNTWQLVSEGSLGVWDHTAYAFKSFLFYLLFPVIFFCAFYGGIHQFVDEGKNIYLKIGVCYEKDTTGLSVIQHFSSYILWTSFLILAIPCTASMLIDAYFAFVNRELAAPRYSQVFNYFIDVDNVMAFCVTLVVGFYTTIAIAADHMDKKNKKLEERRRVENLSNFSAEEAIASVEYQIEQDFPSAVSYIESDEISILRKMRLQLLSVRIPFSKTIDDFRQQMLNEELEEILEELGQQKMLTRQESELHIRIVKNNLEKMQREIEILEREIASIDGKIYNPIPMLAITFVAIGSVFSVYNAAGKIGLLSAALALGVMSLAWLAFKRNPRRMMRSVFLVSLVVGAGFAVEAIQSLKVAIELANGYSMRVSLSEAASAHRH